MRQSTSITGCVRWSVGHSVGRLGNAFVRRSTRRTLLAYLALLSKPFTPSLSPSFHCYFFTYLLPSFYLPFFQSANTLPSFLPCFYPTQFVLLSFTLLCNHYFVPSSIHSFLQSFNHSFIHLFIHSFIRSFSFSFLNVVGKPDLTRTLQ